MGRSLLHIPLLKTTTEAAPLALARPLYSFLPAAAAIFSPSFFLYTKGTQRHGRTLNLRSSPSPRSPPSPANTGNGTRASSASRSSKKSSRGRPGRRLQDLLLCRREHFPDEIRRLRPSSGMNDYTSALPVSSPSDFTFLPSFSGAGGHRSLPSRSSVNHGCEWKLHP